MSERASIRARGPSGRSRGGGSGRGDPSHRGNRGGSNQGTQQNEQQKEKPKRENILDLSKYADKKIMVKFSGGREVTGTLKGFDQLMNLVLDDVEESVRDDESETTRTRPLGLVVARGTLLTSIAPVDGSEEIANPFANTEE